jgi:hypothetical protein
MSATTVTGSVTVHPVSKSVREQNGEQASSDIRLCRATLGLPALVRLASVPSRYPVAFYRHRAGRLSHPGPADRGVQPAEHARRRLPGTRHRRMAGWLAWPSPDRSGARPGLCPDDERHPRRITPRRGAVPAPVPAIATAAHRGLANGGHLHGALPRTPLADCAVMCVQLDPVRHRPTAWTKLRMIAVP